MDEVTMLSRSIIRNQRGQAMVEMALILPLLILLIFGMIQFGLIFNYKFTLDNAVREGARFAAVGPFSDTSPNGETGASTPVKAEIVNRVKNYAVGLNTNASFMSIGVQFQNSVDSAPNPSDARTPSYPALITATYKVNINIPFMSLSPKIGSQAIMRVEQPFS
jgi:Flp pilus assembly protein TadG